MTHLPSRRSISGRLLQINLMVGVAALVLASVSFLLYDALSFRQNLTHSLQAEAQIIGANSVSALLFDDEEAARNTLSALQHSPMIISAVIVKPDGSRFASYTSNGRSSLSDTPPLKKGTNEAQWKRADGILLGSQITLRGKSVGTVYLLASTNEVWQRMRRYLLIALVVLFVSLALALVTTTSLRRVMSDPIIALATTARQVTMEKDYSLRAPQRNTGDEIAVLVESFNEMIEEVQARDRALSASRDLLEQRVVERTAELQAANRELESFSYSVAHDLRGPLDTLGNASFLLRQTDTSGLDEGARELLSMIPRATQRMSALIDDLLNLSRSKRAPLHRELIDLTEIACSVMDDLAEVDPARNITFRAPESAPVIADQGLMRVVLQNLLGNAWKYTSRTAHAQIEFGMQPGEETVYFVRDNGAGFDPALKERLFVPFVRLHSEEEFAGTGIGLATVHRIVTRHGGQLWAAGEVGVGATFFFTVGSNAAVTLES